MVKYVYDAWGNHDAVVVDSAHESIANENPFRYRGYYYDVETELYYLKTRYYDPETGRFINMDSLKYLAPDKINGLNLYAYCDNNPVMKSDPMGTNPEDWLNWLVGALKVIGGALLIAVGGYITYKTALSIVPFSGFVTQLGVSMMAYGGLLAASVFSDTIRKDMENINYNPFNTEVSKVVGANWISFYKGVPVINQDIISNGSGSFFGFIFFDKNMGADTLNHEWGHSVQMWILGLKKYTLTFALPSAIYAGITKIAEGINGGKDLYSLYHSLPWERLADWIVGISRTDHKQYSLETALAYFVLMFISYI